jgi:hypothetical protein
MKIQKAVKATIKLGSIELEGLQFPDGSYHFWLNQLDRVLRIKASDQTGKKYLQPLLETNPKQVNQASVEGIKSTLKTVSLELVLEAVKIYCSLGNAHCIQLAVACLGESLERRLDAAFNVVRTEQERNDKLEARIDHADGWRKNFTRWQKLDGCIESREYAERVRELKTYANLPVDISIKEYDSKLVKKMTTAEVVYDTARRIGKTHLEALMLV